MHWNLRKSESSDNITKTLSTQFEKNKHKKSSLFKALVATTKGFKALRFVKTLLGMFLWVLFLKLLKGLLEFSGPLLIREIITYTSSEEKDLKRGIFLVAGIILSRVFITLLNSRSEILLV